MAYATVADLRDEGVTDAQASNTRLDLLIEEATQIIDRVTGWFFEPRRLTLHLDGRGTPTLELPFPLIKLYELLVKNGRTPLEIRRACMLLVVRMLTPLSDTACRADVVNQWRIVEERTRDQSYKLAQTEPGIQLVGDPEIDSILARYCRPMEIGTV